MSRLVVTASVLNLRAGPGVQHAIVARLLHGEVVDALRVAPANGWRRVKATRRDGAVTGWVSGTYVDDVIEATPVAKKTKPPRWFEVAQGELGVKEYAGPSHNPRIAEYAARTTLAAKDDETPWCSSFVNWCLWKAKLDGTGSAAARSWLDWGVPLKKPVVGCVTVFRRGTSPTSGHVAFFIQDRGSLIDVLGGNQSNQVKVSAYRADGRLGYRWPKGVEVPGA